MEVVVDSFKDQCNISMHNVEAHLVVVRIHSLCQSERVLNQFLLRLIRRFKMLVTPAAQNGANATKSQPKYAYKHLLQTKCKYFLLEVSSVKCTCQII
ncbi:MAG: hypothetical protein ACRC41_18350 [Sarcina sp.]